MPENQVGRRLVPADARGLHRVYWELLGLTEVCVQVPTRPSPLELSFVLVFPGKSVEGAPLSILLRLQGRAWTGPELPAFSLHADDRRLDLMVAPRRHELTYPCPPGESCAFDGVVAAVTEAELRLIAGASVIAGQLFGVDFTVPAGEPRALRHLVELLERGAVSAGGPPTAPWAHRCPETTPGGPPDSDLGPAMGG